MNECTAVQARPEKIKPPSPDAQLRSNGGRGDCGDCALLPDVVKTESRMTQDLLPTACSVCHRIDFKEYRGLSEWAARHYRLNYEDEQLKGASMCFGKAPICTPCRKKLPKEPQKGKTGRKTVAKKVDKLLQESALEPEAEFECGRCHGSFESTEFRDWQPTFSAAIDIDQTFRECFT